jgi:Transposase IS4
VFMSRNRFEDILYALQYTLMDPPLYKDKFFEIREIVEAWNKNMEENFNPSWASCLDESMMEWTNQYTCPGFMFVPRKPHPFGNEWHSICCGLSGIMYAVELVEGKDKPPNHSKEFDEKGKTVGLLLRLTKRIWSTGKIVVLDSGFCVLKGIIELRQRGVFAAAVIKKRRYWPKYIPGEQIQQHFAGQEVGSVDALGGTLDGVPFHVFCMKDDGYVTMLMSSYGTNERVGNDKIRFVEGEKMVFKYPEVVSNHYRYRHAVDDHNAKRHAPISFEKRWGTKYWKDRVFAFLLSITEVNCMLADVYFNSSNVTAMLDFRKSFAKAMINNSYYSKELVDCHLDARRSARLSDFNDHELLTLPKKMKFSMHRIVDSVSDYPQAKCIGCTSRCRTYCRCSPGEHRCKECYAKHIATVDILH